MSGHPDNAMICLFFVFFLFFYICFHKIIVTVEGSFILNIRNTYFNNTLDGFFWQPKLNKHCEKLKVDYGRLLTLFSL